MQYIIFGSVNSCTFVCIEFQSKWGAYFRGRLSPPTSKKGWISPVLYSDPMEDWCPMPLTFQFIWEPCKVLFDIKWIS